MQRARGIQSLPNQKEEEKLFEEFRKKKCAFFMIVFEPDCTEEDVQVAYEKVAMSPFRQVLW